MNALIHNICASVNGAPAYLRHHKRQSASSDVTVQVPQLCFEKARESLLKHPFVTRAGIAADKIYRIMLAILATESVPTTIGATEPPSHEPPRFDPMNHDIQCERCAAVGFFERKYGAGGHTCNVCGYANYTDIYRGEPTWLGADNERSHWEAAIPPDTKDTEHTATIERIGVFIHATRDMRTRALHILRVYRNTNTIASIEVVAAAALIIATNESLASTHTIEVPQPPSTPFTCATCEQKWARAADAKVCCRHGANFIATKVRRVHFSMRETNRPDFDLDAQDTTDLQ